jgi:hypothetical protein
MPEDLNFLDKGSEEYLLVTKTAAWDAVKGLHTVYCVPYLIYVNGLSPPGCIEEEKAFKIFAKPWVVVNRRPRDTE